MAQGREVALVVGSQVGVDGEFAAKGAGVGGAVEESLWRAEDAEGVLEGGSEDDFFFGGVEGLAGLDVRSCHVRFHVEFFAFDVVFAVVAAGETGVAGDGAGNLHDLLPKLFGGNVSFTPFSGGRVVAEEPHAGCRGDDQDERHDERYSPCLIRAETLVEAETYNQTAVSVRNAAVMQGKWQNLTHCRKSAASKST